MALVSAAVMLGSLTTSPAVFGSTSSPIPPSQGPLPPFAGSGVAPAAPLVDPGLDGEVATKGRSTVIVALADATPSIADAQAMAPAERVWRAGQNRQRADALVASLPAGSAEPGSVMPNLGMMSMSVDAAGLEALRHNPLVGRVAPNRHYSPQVVADENLIAAPHAWSFGSGLNGAGQSVAILDTGVNLYQGWFSGTTIEPQSCHSDDSNGPVYDRSLGYAVFVGMVTELCPLGVPDGSNYLYKSYVYDAGRSCSQEGCDHGSLVAGIAAGGDGATTGVGSGVAYGADLITEQVYSDAQGPAFCPDAISHCLITFDDAIFAAVDDLLTLQSNGAHIAAANLSLGGGNWDGAGPCDGYDAAQINFHAVLSSLIAAGIAPIVSAGDDYADYHNGIAFPACDSFAVSVGAIDAATDGFVAGVSPHPGPPGYVPDYATFSQDSGLTRLLAPGFDVTSSDDTGNFEFAYGTSMSAPFVTGAWAVIKQEHPNWGFDDILGLLRATGFPIRDSRPGALGESTPRLNLGAAVDPPTFHPMAPQRIIDTRLGYQLIGKVHGGQTITFSANLATGVPGDATGVVLNVTAINPSTGGYLTVFPGGLPRPLASNLNLNPGVNQPNLVETKLGVDGTVSIFNDNATLDLAVDITGWYDAGGAAANGGHFHAVDPARLLDSRDGTGMAGGVAARLDPGEAGITSLQVTGGTSPVPAGATAVVLNLTAVSPTKAGYLTAWPSDGPRQVTSNLNFEAGVTVPNLAVVKLSADGRVSFFHDVGQIDLLADVAGWIDDGTTASDAGHFVPLESRRLLDSRNGVGMPGGVATRFGPQTIDLQVLGRDGVPTDGVSAVVLNITAISPSTYTYLTAWPSGVGQPVVSNLNPPVGRTTPNLVTVKVGANGKVSINNFGGNVHVIVDVAGWYTS